MRQFLGIFTYCDFDCTPLLYTTKNSNEETNKLIANEESCWQQKILNLVTKIWLNEMRGNERIKEDHDCLFISFCFVTQSFSRKKPPILKILIFYEKSRRFHEKITNFEFFWKIAWRHRMNPDQRKCLFFEIFPLKHYDNNFDFCRENSNIIKEFS